MADTQPERSGPPATSKQHRELRRLADRTGTAFTYPNDVGEASREIQRLSGLRSQHRGVARADSREVSRAMAAPRAASDFQDRETTGHGSSARWESAVAPERVDMRTGADYDVRIDRKTRWGNPYEVGRDGTPAEVVESYKQHLWAQVKSGEVTKPELAELSGKTLGCWCPPSQPCHGDVLSKAAGWANRELAREIEPARGVEAPAVNGAEPKPLAGSRADHIAAALEKPGSHITSQLGQAPESPTMRRGWERAVKAIERYRFESGVTGPEALGPKPEGGRELRRFNNAQAELTRGRQVLGLDATPSVSPSLAIGL